MSSRAALPAERRPPRPFAPSALAVCAERRLPRPFAQSALASSVAALALVALVWAGVAGLAADAGAHTRSVSHSVWRLDAEGATVRVRLSALDRSALGEIGERDIEGVLTGALWLEGRLGRCAPVRGSFAELGAEPGSWRFEWRVGCAGIARPWRARSALLFEEIPGHLHMLTALESTEAGGARGEGDARGGAEAGRLIVERVLSAEAPSVGVAEGVDEGAGWRLIAIGVEHILTGWDHLAFVAMLVLGATSWRALALTVTGFTLGHCATLAMAWGGLVRVDVPSIEAMIGLSIALVAAENVWSRQGKGARIPVVVVAAIAASALVAVGRGGGLWLCLVGVGIFAACHFALSARTEKPERWQGLVAMLFGLVHGFGFAGVFGGQGVGVSLWSLFCFNVGVELGQLALIAGIWPLLAWGRRRGLHDRIVAWGSMAGASLGMFWFVDRIF